MSGGQGRDREKGKEKDQVLAKAQATERRKPLSAAVQKLRGWEFSCPANELCAQGLNALSLKTCVLPGGESLQEQSQMCDTLPYAPIYMVLSIQSDPNTGEHHRWTLILLFLILCCLSTSDPQGTCSIVNLTST